MGPMRVGPPSGLGASCADHRRSKQTDIGRALARKRHTRTRVRPHSHGRGNTPRQNVIVQSVLESFSLAYSSHWCGSA